MVNSAYLWVHNPIPKIPVVYPYHVAQLTVRNRLKWLSTDYICLLRNRVQDPGRSQRLALGRAVSSVGQGIPWQCPLHMLRVLGWLSLTSLEECGAGKALISFKRPGLNKVSDASFKSLKVLITFFVIIIQICFYWVPFKLTKSGVLGK